MRSKLTTPFQNVIEINRPPVPVYQTVIEKTRQLAVRTQALGVTVGRAAQPTAAAPSATPNTKDQVVMVK
jgi:translation initiation factor 3 subunit E